MLAFWQDVKATERAATKVSFENNLFMVVVRIGK